MCDPITALTAASMFFSATQQMSAGKYQRDVARYNARVAQNTAQEVRNQGNEAENAHRERVAQLQSQQRAQVGANGVDLTSGSALQIQEDTLVQGEADALRIRGNVGSKVDSLNTQSQLLLSQGEQANNAGQMGAVGSLLKSSAAIMGTGVADKWFSPTSAANDVGTTVSGATATKLYGNFA